MNLPGYDFLSAPLWLISLLHVLTLSLHFAAMNFVVGGILVVLTGRFPDRWDDPTVQKLVRLFPSVMAAVVTLGVAPLLFVQLVFPRQIYSSSIVSGWFWLMVVPAVILSYYSLYAASFSGANGARRGAYFLLALVGFLYVSLVYSSVFSMSERPDLIQKLYAGIPSGTVWNPSLGDYAWRWLHMMLGAVTVGGFFVAFLGRDNPAAYVVGRKFFLWGFVLSSCTGVGYLLSLGPILPGFMRTPGAWSLIVGILLALGSMHLLFTHKLGICAGMLFSSLVLMVVNRHYVRLVRLEGQFDPSGWKVQMQTSPFLMFLACFIASIGLVWYMLRLFFRKV